MFCFTSVNGHSQRASIKHRRFFDSELFLGLRQRGGDKWNALFRFTVYLRCAPHGSDSTWVKAPRRETGRKLNWFQLNEKKLAEMRQQSETTVTARLSRWIEQGQELRKQFSVQLTQPDLLECLSPNISKHRQTMTDLPLHSASGSNSFNAIPCNSHQFSSIPTGPLRSGEVGKGYKGMIGNVYEIVRMCMNVSRIILIYVVCSMLISLYGMKLQY